MREAFNRRIAGNGVAHLPGAAALGAVEQDLPLQVTIVLRPLNRRAHHPPTVLHPGRREAYSHADLAARYDPGDERIALARRFAKRHRLSVVEVSRARHDVVVQGSAAQLSRAFGVSLRNYEARGARYRAHDERIHLPPELRPSVENVLGLDDIPTHRSHAAATRTASGLSVSELERK